MLNRSKVGTNKPNPRYAHLCLTHIPIEPQTIKTALHHPGWTAAMQEEIVALVQNNTWDLVP